MVNKLSTSYYKTYNIDRKYRNTAPRIIIDDVYKNIRIQLDREIKILKLQVPVDNRNNREWCYWAESTCQTFVNLISSSVVGSGLRVKCNKNKKAEEIIHQYNKRINGFGMSMEDLLHYAFIDNAIHGFSVWRIMKIPEEPYVDLGRLDVNKVMPIPGEQKSWLKFILKDYYNESAPKTKREFLSTSYSPSYEEETKEPHQTGTLIEWHIPVESTLHLNLVSRPPMSSALQYVIFKRWILWFMRKCAEKAWMPPIIGTLGNKDKQFELSPDDEDTQMRRFAKQLARLSSFGVMVKVFGEDVDTLQDKTSVQARQTFVEQIRLLDEQIIFAMGGTLGFTGVEKSEIGESRQKENMLIRAIQSHRTRIGNQLENFYINVLLPEHGINLKPGDLEMDWSHLKEDRNLEIVEMAVSAYTEGLLGYEEARKILKTIWNFIDPEDKSALKDFDKYITTQAKSKPAFGQPGGSSSSYNKDLKRKTQATRPSSQKTGATQKRG